jgi:hypothetical protein
VVVVVNEVEEAQMPLRPAKFSRPFLYTDKKKVCRPPPRPHRRHRGYVVLGLNGMRGHVVEEAVTGTTIHEGK